MYEYRFILQNERFMYTVVTVLHMKSVLSLSHTEIGFLLALGALLILLISYLRLEWKLNRLLLGGRSANLDETLSYLKGKADNYDLFRSDLEKYLTDVENRLRKSVQGVGMVRFNPFRGSGSGGNQSFASAFVNESGDGIIISTLYARDHVSVFAKPVRKFKSEFELTDEEKQALSQAKEELK